METGTLERGRFGKASRKLAKVISSAVLAASIFTSAPARADPPPSAQGASFIGGARFSTSPGLSFDPLGQRLRYSSLSYGLGDDDFRLRFEGNDVKVLDYLRNADFSDISSILNLLQFGRALRESLGIYSPGEYHRELRGDLDAFGEGYTLGAGNFDGRAYGTELGFRGYLSASGRAFLDARLDYDNWSLPARFNGDMRAGFSAQMRSGASLGLETSPVGGTLRLGYGIAGRRFTDFDGAGIVAASINAGLLSGFDASASADLWTRTSHGYDLLPYLVLGADSGPLRLQANLGINLRYEESRSSSSHHSVRRSSDDSRNSSEDASFQADSTMISAIPVLSTTIGLNNQEHLFPILSLSTRDMAARGTLGVRSGRLLASGSLSSDLSAGAETFVVLNGNIGARDFSDYLFANDAAISGFFPAYRSRMLRARQAFLASSDAIMLRSSLDYDQRFREISSENGIAFSKRRLFLESGVRLFGGESFGAGVYNSVGTRGFFTTQSYSSSVAGGRNVQEFMLTIGGYIP